jgi:sphinganine-1-phosphate aldolase
MALLFKQNKFKKIDFFDNGQDEYTILKKLENFAKSDEISSSCGKLTGTVYCKDDKINRIAARALEIFSYSNLLHPDLYCGARFIESQLIKIGLELFNGKEDSCGMTTSGGTMSILTAMYSYIHRARVNGIKKPEIICPLSVHAAFFKACSMFKAKCIKIPLDPLTYQVDLNKVKKAINKNTACIVGSCPNFPHSVMDNIEGLNEIAVKYKVPLHVDCCLGGFLVAFYSRANIKIPKFDFSLPGVTSISADLHKYGLCPKGISLLMYSKHEYRKYNYFTYPHFMGGFYCTPGFDGSRTAGISAASYAVLTSLGRNYYINVAKRINQAVLKVKEFVKKNCPLFKIIGDPFICGFAITGDKMDYLYDILAKKGWHVNMLIKPYGIGFIFTSANMENDAQLINDIKEAHEKISKNELEELSKMTKIYGMAIPLPESIAKKSLDALCDAILD